MTRSWLLQTPGCQGEGLQRECTALALCTLASPAAMGSDTGTALQMGRVGDSPMTSLPRKACVAPEGWQGTILESLGLHFLFATS